MGLKYFETALRIPGLKLPARSTLITEGRTRILISPIPFTATQLQELRQEGDVTDIVAPNLFHHLFATKAQKHFPHAALWCAPGLENKRTDVRWNKSLTRESWPHAPGVEMLFIKGVPIVNEVVFFHPRTRTLVVTDLVFNIVKPKGWAAPFVLRALGTHKKFNTSRLLQIYLKDRKAFRSSMETLLRWDFDRIVMGHGAVVESGGKQLLEDTLRARKWIG